MYIFIWEFLVIYRNMEVEEYYLEYYLMFVENFVMQPECLVVFSQLKIGKDFWTIIQVRYGNLISFFNNPVIVQRFTFPRTKRTTMSNQRIDAVQKERCYKVVW